MGIQTRKSDGECDKNIFLPDPCRSSYLKCCQNGRDPFYDSFLTIPPQKTQKIMTTTTTTTTTPKVIGMCEKYGQNFCNNQDNTYCVDINSTFRCQCKDGFERLSDFGPCKLSKPEFITCDTLKCGKNGHPYCQPNEGKDAECVCMWGYRKVSNEICEDIDECDDPNPFKPCGIDENCVNTHGGFDCYKECKTGYQKLNGDCKARIDITPLRLSQVKNLRKIM